MSFPQGRSITETPFFDGTNYPEWKVRMEWYIKANFGMYAWISSIRTEWKEVNKPYELWMEIEKEICGYNSKVLNAIFCSVGDQQFKRIFTCKTAKDAWDTLQASYDKSKELRDAELSVLSQRFDNLHMGENETISSFYKKLVGIAYAAGTLGKPYSNQQLVSKVLYSCSERFRYKVALVDDPSAVKLENLIDSLKAYELILERNFKLKNSPRYY